MITVHKQHIADWITIGYLADLHTVSEKLRYFEQKYSQTLEEFSGQLKESSSENFDRWDDYIEWKAYAKTDKDHHKHTACGIVESTEISLKEVLKTIQNMIA